MPREHRAYAAIYSALALAGELTGYGSLRRDALAGAWGRLLVVGLGPGHDLRHLPAAVSSVVAVEPRRPMRVRSSRRVIEAPAPAWLVGGVAEALPLPSASVDSALAALVFCSVTDPHRSAAELRRVLRPGGRLHVLEHVRAPAGSRLRWWQDRLDGTWSRLAAGCHVNRETREVLADAGFDVSGLRNLTVRRVPPPVASQLVGVARRP